eukprot:gene3340-6610_t
MASKSSRWMTTTSSALAEIDSKARDEVREQNMKYVKERQILKHSGGTSISFGNEKISYLTNMKEQMAKSGGIVLDPKEYAANAIKIKTIKAELSQSTCVFGDTSERTSYETTTKSAMNSSARAAGQDCRSHPKEVSKDSAIYFGSTPCDYSTENRRANSAKNGDREEFKSRRAEVVAMKQNLLKRNFTLGEEPVEYISDYQRGYAAFPPESYVKGGKEDMKHFLDDTRKCHFSLGQDKVDYTSNTSRALQNGATGSLVDAQKQSENCRELKKKLMMTSFVIGDDADYE